MENLLSHKSCLEKFQPIACLAIPHSVETKIENKITVFTFYREILIKEETILIYNLNSREVKNYKLGVLIKVLTNLIRDFKILYLFLTDLSID